MDVVDSLQYLVKDIKLRSYSSDLFFSEEIGRYSYYKRYCFFDGGINTIMLSPHLMHLAFSFYVNRFNTIPYLVQCNEAAFGVNNCNQVNNQLLQIDSLFHYYDGFTTFLISHELSHAKLGQKNIYGETIPEADEKKCDCNAILKCKEQKKLFDPLLFTKFLKIVARKDEIDDVNIRSRQLIELISLSIDQLQIKCK